MYSAIQRGLRLWLRARGFRSRWLKTSFGALHALDGFGRGRLPPIVLLHGLSSSGAEYNPLLIALKRWSQRIVAPDLPGHGFSPLPPEGLTPTTAFSHLTHAMDHLIEDIIGEPAWVLGNSLGGHAAIEYASQSPENVKGLLLIAPAGAPMDESQLQVLLERLKLPTYADALDFVDRLFQNPPKIRRLYAYGVRNHFHRPEVRQILSQVRPEHQLTPEKLAHLTMPVLLLWGPSDRVLPFSGYQFFRDHLPEHAQVEAPAGFGHCPFIDSLEPLTDRVVTFMAKNSVIRPTRRPAPFISVRRTIGTLAAGAGLVSRGDR